MKYSNQANNRPPPNKPSVRNPYVKPKTIGSSLQSISTETEKYREATNKANAERQALLERLTACKAKSNALAESIRTAHDKLGAVQREFNLLERQEKTTRDKSVKERQELEELTTDIQNRELSDKQDRKKFCSEMEDINKELGALLHEQEKRRVASLIHPEASVEDFLESGNKNKGNELDEIPMTDEEMSIYREALRTALSSMQRTAATFEHHLAQKGHFEDQIEMARRHVLENQPPVKHTADSSGGNTVRSPVFVLSFSFHQIIMVAD